MMRRFFIALLALGTLVPLRAAGAADTIDVPVIVSLTGPSAFVGRGTQQSLQMAAEVINRSGGIRGRQLNFVFHDDQTNPQVGVQLMNAQIDAHAAVVVGSDNVGICQAMAAVIKDGPVQYCLSPGVHPEEGSYLFSALTSTADALEIAVRYFHDMGWRRIAVITATDATGQDADRILDQTIDSLHGQVTIVDREHFNPPDIAVTAQIARIKNANPQVLISWTTGTPEATVLRGLKDAGFDMPVLTSFGNAVNAVMTQQWASFLPNNFLITAQANLAPQQVTDRGVKAALDAHFAELTQHEMKPDVANAGGWDVALLITEALRKLGPEATGPQIRAFLANTRSFPGISGRYDFKAIPQRGIGRNVMYIARWDPTKQGWTAVSRAGGAPLR